MKCSKIRTYLIPYAEGSLPEGLIRSVEEHLSRCNSCSCEFEELKQTVNVLRQADYPAMEPSFDLQSRVMAQIAKEPLRRSWLTNKLQAYSAAAAAFLILIVVSVTMGPDVFHRPITGSQPKEQEIPSVAEKKPQSIPRPANTPRPLSGTKSADVYPGKQSQSYSGSLKPTVPVQRQPGIATELDQRQTVSKDKDFRQSYSYSAEPHSNKADTEATAVGSRAETESAPPGKGTLKEGLEAKAQFDDKLSLKPGVSPAAAAPTGPAGPSGPEVVGRAGGFSTADEALPAAKEHREVTMQAPSFGGATQQDAGLGKSYNRARGETFGAGNARPAASENVMKKKDVDKKEDITLLKRKLREFPNSPTALTDLLKAYSDAGRTEDEYSIATRLTKLDPNNAGYWLMRAQAAEKAKMRYTAISCYRQAIKLNLTGSDLELAKDRLKSLEDKTNK